MKSLSTRSLSYLIEVSTNRHLFYLNEISFRQKRCLFEVSFNKISLLSNRSLLQEGLWSLVHGVIHKEIQEDQVSYKERYTKMKSLARRGLSYKQASLLSKWNLLQEDLRSLVQKKIYKDEVFYKKISLLSGWSCLQEERHEDEVSYKKISLWSKWMKAVARRSLSDLRLWGGYDE